MYNKIFSLKLLYYKWYTGKKEMNYKKLIILHYGMNFSIMNL